MDRSKPAPKFLNLLQIRLPAGGIASIAHRVSGVFLFLSVPLLAWLFGLSLESEAGYAEAAAWLQSAFGRLVTVVLVWSLAHHLLAGVRHLLLDVEIGIEKRPARISAWLVNLGGLLLALLYLVALS